MTPQDLISRPLPEFRARITGMDRGALIELRSLLIAAPQKDTHKLVAVEAQLSKKRAQNAPTVPKNGHPDRVANVVTIRLVDAEDGSEFLDQIATMGPLHELMARIHRDPAFGPKPPAVVYCFRQPDLDSIPDEIWDDTRPSPQEMVNLEDIPENQPEMHVLFSP